MIFEVFHNGQPVNFLKIFKKNFCNLQADAVVVGSRITLAFTPYFAIPRKKIFFLNIIKSDPPL